MTRKGVSETILERLDRALCSNEWRLMFVEGFVKHLPRVTSDHCPIVLCLHSSYIPQNSLKPFRFEVVWLKHNQFCDAMKQFWNMHGTNLVENVLLHPNMLREWNKNIFCCIFQKKRRLFSRLLGIQRSLGEKLNPGLIKLESRLKIQKYLAKGERQEY